MSIIKQRKTSLELSFRINTPQLIQEIAQNNGVAILKVPLNILQRWLEILAQRAIEIDDPELNIIMLSLALYDGTPQELTTNIEKQYKRLKDYDK